MSTAKLLAAAQGLTKRAVGPMAVPNAADYNRARIAKAPTGPRTRIPVLDRLDELNKEQGFLAYGGPQVKHQGLLGPVAAGVRGLEAATAGGIGYLGGQAWRGAGNLTDAMGLTNSAGQLGRDFANEAGELGVRGIHQFVHNRLTTAADDMLWQKANELGPAGRASMHYGVMLPSYLLPAASFHRGSKMLRLAPAAPIQGATAGAMYGVDPIVRSVNPNDSHTGELLSPEKQVMRRLNPREHDAVMTDVRRAVPQLVAQNPTAHPSEILDMADQQAMERYIYPQGHGTPRTEMPQRAPQQPIQPVAQVPRAADTPGASGPQGAQGDPVDYVTAGRAAAAEKPLDSVQPVAKQQTAPAGDAPDVPNPLESPEGRQAAAAEINSANLPPDQIAPRVGELFAADTLDKARRIQAEEVAAGKEARPLEVIQGEIVGSRISGEPDAEDTQKGLENLEQEKATELGTTPEQARKFPQWAETLWNMWMGLDNWQKAGVIIGISSAVVAGLNAALGGDGMTSLFGGLGALGGAALAFHPQISKFMSGVGDKYGFGGGAAATQPPPGAVSTAGPTTDAERIAADPTAALNPSAAPAPSAAPPAPTGPAPIGPAPAAPVESAPAPITGQVQAQADPSAAPAAPEQVDVNQIMQDISNQHSWVNRFGGDDGQLNSQSEVGDLIANWASGGLSDGITFFGGLRRPPPSDAEMQALVATLQQNGYADDVKDMIVNSPQFKTRASPYHRQRILSLFQ